MKFEAATRPRYCRFLSVHRRKGAYLKGTPCGNARFRLPQNPYVESIEGHGARVFAKVETLAVLANAEVENTDGGLDLAGGLYGFSTVIGGGSVP